MILLIDFSMWNKFGLLLDIIGIHFILENLD